MLKSTSYICLMTTCLSLSSSDLFAGDLINWFIDGTHSALAADQGSGGGESGGGNVDDKSGDPAPTTTPTFKCCPISSMATVDWLNSINVGNFFDYSSKYILTHNECFSSFDSFDSFSLWGEPYGFYAHYNSEEQAIDFTLSSFGIGTGGRFDVTNQIRLGGGIGYFHSNVDKKENKNKSTVNGLYFGPSVQYLYPDGWVSFTAIGIGNFYSGNSTVEETKIDYTMSSWDLDLRLETEYCLDMPSDFFIPNLTFRPFLRLDYLNVFELSHQDKADEFKIDVESRNSSFFYSKLGVRFEKVILCHQMGILTGNIDLGWINMSPLSSNPLKCSIEGLPDLSCSEKPESKNQAALGFSLVGMHKEGALVALEYQAAVGANSPIQTGRLRFEWNW